MYVFLKKFILMQLEEICVNLNWVCDHNKQTFPPMTGCEGHCDPLHPQCHSLHRRHPGPVPALCSTGLQAAQRQQCGHHRLVSGEKKLTPDGEKRSQPQIIPEKNKEKGLKRAKKDRSGFEWQYKKITVFGQGSYFHMKRKPDITVPQATN